MPASAHSARNPARSRAAASPGPASVPDKGKRFIDDTINPVEFGRCNAIGSKHVNDISECAQQHVSFKIKRIQRRPKGGQVAGIANIQLNRGDGSRLPRRCDLRPAGERRESARVIPSD